MKIDESEFLLKMINGIYPKAIRSENLPQLQASLRGFAESNRLQSALAEILPASDNQLERWRNDQARYLIQIKSAITELRGLVSLQDFAVIKTFSSYSHTTHDLDVVVRSEIEMRSLQNKLRIKNSKIEIDLHQQISWTSTPEISRDFFWKHMSKLRLGKTSFLVPDPTLDALIRIAHLPFEVGFIRFGELMHIYRQLRRIDKNLLKQEADKCGWAGTYHRVMRLLEELHLILFSESFSGVRQKPVFRSIYFPYHLPLGLMAAAVVEKRAWQKIWGARYIIWDRMKIKR